MKMGTLARIALAAVVCLAVAGCNTANTPLTSDEGNAALGPAQCPSGMIEGGGSALHRTAFEEVLAAYGERCAKRASVGFNAFPADAAPSAFAEAKLDWIATGAPLEGTARTTAAARCSPGALLTLPMLANPIVLTYHLPGIDRLVLTGAVAGHILDGTITTWDHPDIAAINPGVPLPAEQIVVVGRADASSTTEVVSRYLAAVGAWPQERVGADWAGAGEPKENTTGIMQAIRGTPNSIGYAELSAARNNGLSVAWLDSGAGPVEPTVASAGRTLAGAPVTGGDGELTVTPELTGATAGSYPLISIGYQVTCQAGLVQSKSPLVRDFLGFLVSEPQQQSLGELGLIPLPTELTEQVTDSVSEIH